MQRAHIKDFRSIRDAKVEFKPGLNIIIGANGSGKTNFVRVVSNAIDMGKSEYEVGKDSSFILNGREEIEFHYSLEARVVNKNLPLGVDNSPPYQQTLTVRTKKGQGKGVAILPTILANYSGLFDENAPFFYQLTVLNHGIPIQYPLVAGQYDFVLNALNRQTDSSEARLPAFALAAISSSLVMDMVKEKYLEVNDVQARLERIIDFFLASIKPDLVRYTPVADVRINNALKIYHDKQQNKFVAQGLVLEFLISGQWLPFQSLSSGTQRMFYIVSELVLPNGTVVKVNDEETLVSREIDRIILLEEPELGIHPDQLHKLLLFLREQSEKYQLIITTHSPQVLDMLNEDELDRITICELDENKGTQFRKLKKAQIATAKKYMKEVGFLSDYWRYGSLEENN